MVRPSLTTTVVMLLVGMLGFVAFAASQRGRVARSAQPPARGEAAPQRGAPRPTEVARARPLQPLREVAPPRPPAHPVLRVRPGRTVALRSSPRGEVRTRVAATTQFGSPTTLAVAAERAGWLGVTSTELANGKLGWVKKKDAALDQRRTRLEIRIDLSRRRLRLVDGDRVVRSATVSIGRPGSSTPTGRFAVTDKLPGAKFGSYYGCCIIALSGHQPNLPPGWPGGDRLAIHGTPNPSSIGTRASAGCLHAGAPALRSLMRRVPLGTPVFIGK